MSKRREDLLLEVDNRSVYIYYYERLVNLALAQFEWSGLPDTVDRRYMEKTLLFNGTAAWFKPTATDFWLCLNWVHQGGKFDVYGYPTAIKGIDFNGRQIETDDFHIVYDNMSRVPMMRNIQNYASLLAQAHLTGRANMMRQNTPYIVSTTKTELLSVKNIFQRIMKFDPVVEVKQGMDLEKKINKIDLDVPFKANEIMEYRRALWNDALSMLGIASETTKKERLIGDEIAMNRQEDTVALNARLLTRVELCNKLNDKYGLDLAVNMSDTAIDDPGEITDEILSQTSSKGEPGKSEEA